MSVPKLLIRYLRGHPPDFTLGFQHHLVPGHCGMHTHGDLEVVYHRRLHGYTTLEDGRRYAFVPGSVVLYPPLLPHDQDSLSSGEDLCVQIALGGSPPPPLNDVLYIPPPLPADLKREIVFLAQTPPPHSDGQKLLLGCRAQLLLLRLLAGEETPTQKIRLGNYAQTAYRIIHENYRTIDKLAEVAQRINVSYDYLRHIFRARYGRSLKRCLLDARIDRARSLLHRSPLPLKAIADQCGFRDVAYFWACFRRVTGQAPGAFRRQVRAAQRI